MSLSSEHESLDSQSRWQASMPIIHRAPKRKRITLFALLRQVAQVGSLLEPPANRLSSDSQSLQRPLNDVLRLQTINVCAWLIQNAYLLGKGCAWFDLFPSYLTLFQWTCFNFVRLLWPGNADRCSKLFLTIRAVV